MKIAVPEPLKELAKRLSQPIYIVGGFVRNSILFGSQNSTDIDICGVLTPDQLKSELLGVAKVKDVNPRIGTVLVISSGEEYEYTTFRRDSYPIGGVHTPATVEFVTDMKYDVLRRDFTVNALYCNVSTGEVIDLCGGLSDIEDHKLRTVRRPLETFSEDGLRLLRLVRFACELCFDIEEETAKGARESATQLVDISGERKREELNRILVSDQKYKTTPNVYYGIKLMAELDLWKNFLPFDAIKTIDKHIEDFKILDNVDYRIRLEVFATNLVKYYGENAIKQIFAQDGLVYANVDIDKITCAYTLAQTQMDEIELMLFLVKNRWYRQELALLSDNLKLGIDIESIYELIKNNGLPLRPKDLDISKSDFDEYGVKFESRGLALGAMIRKSYSLKRSLTRKEKLQILKEYGGEKNGN